MRQLRLALVQMNAAVGDLRGNVDRMLATVEQARAGGADVVAFPELAITGYPPEDLLFKRQFIAEAGRQLERLVTASGGITVIAGVPDLANGDLYNTAAASYPDLVTGRLYNAAAVAYRGELVNIYHKVFLPNYGVFDEARYFAPGEECPVFEINGVNVGVNVCEDIWYDVGPTTVQRGAGAAVVININASPYHRGKGAQREQMLARRAKDHGLFVAYVNMVGGQDELVFDGQSLVLDPGGVLVSRGPQFEEALLLVDIDADRVKHPPPDGAKLERLSERIGAPRHYHLSAGTDAPRPAVQPVVCEPMDPLTEVYAALVTGTGDYVRKSGFQGVVIGLSGGIDSALTAAIAVDALGAEAVHTLFMPSRFTSEASYRDAKQVADNLVISMQTVHIDDVLDGYLRETAPLFEGRAPDTTEENIQARIRGNLLMAVSNKLGWLVLTTGNKSEMATGYCTLYGDMAGGFAIIKDVPKTLVQKLAEHRNRGGSDVIPVSILTKPPSAELRPDQKDEDSLPPYAVLDPILQAYVEDDWSVEEMVAAGMPPEAIAQTVRLVDLSEYKRRQSPPGVKITHRAFGRDRRLPLVNRFRPS